MSTWVGVFLSFNGVSSKMLVTRHIRGILTTAGNLDSVGIFWLNRARSNYQESISDLAQLKYRLLT